VPAWPVRAPVTRRICATIANDDGPAGLSTSAIPAGSSARGGTLLQKPLADELGDLIDRLLAREAGGLPVPAALEDPGDRRHVELLEPGVHVRARVDELRRETQCLRRRVRVLETPGVGDEGDVERLRDLRRQLDAELCEDVPQHLPGRRRARDDQVDVAEAR